MRLRNSSSGIQCSASWLLQKTPRELAAEAILERALHAHSRPAASAGPTLLTSFFQCQRPLSVEENNGADATLARISEALHSGVPSRVDSIFTDGLVKLEGLEVLDSLTRKESRSAKASGAFLCRGCLCVRQDKGIYAAAAAAGAEFGELNRSPCLHIP
jgi:hypothetical protein